MQCHPRKIHPRKIHLWNAGLEERRYSDSAVLKRKWVASSVPSTTPLFPPPCPATMHATMPALAPRKLSDMEKGRKCTGATCPTLLYLTLHTSWCAQTPTSVPPRIRMVLPPRREGAEGDGNLLRLSWRRWGRWGRFCAGSIEARYRCGIGVVSSREMEKSGMNGKIERVYD